jgi:uncharacterized membrane protein YidH (DUF202 family)
MDVIQSKNKTVDNLARIGLSAKGIVYLALGALAFMAALEWAGHNEKEASRTGVFQWLKDMGGSWLLILIVAGLACYCIWRFVQAFSNSGRNNKPAKRVRYFFSGLAYTSVAFTAAQLALGNNNSGGGGNEHWMAEVLSKPAGEILAWIIALLFAGIGIYQLYYSLSGKYKKHVEGLNLHDNKSKALLQTGKIGYIARGIVWLIISFLLGRAAMHSNASEAGDSSKAFQLVEGTFGSYILAAIGLGLIAYGIFSLVRAKYEHF